MIFRCSFAKSPTNSLEMYKKFTTESSRNSLEPNQYNHLLICKDFETFFELRTIVRSPIFSTRGLLAQYFMKKYSQQTIKPTSLYQELSKEKKTQLKQEQEQTVAQHRIFILSAPWEGTNPWLQRPNNSWAYKILYLAEEKKSLQVTSAYVSTLGGGYFMCRFIGEAKNMARKQLLIAEKLGDKILQSKCRTHLIYSDIQLGNFHIAKTKLMKEMIVAKCLNDIELISIIQSALHFCQQCYELNQNIDPIEVGHVGKLAIEDEYYRMRVVKTK
jgi:hypothetical protein